MRISWNSLTRSKKRTSLRECFCYFCWSSFFMALGPHFFCLLKLKSICDVSLGPSWVGLGIILTNFWVAFWTFCQHAWEVAFAWIFDAFPMPSKPWFFQSRLDGGSILTFLSRSLLTSILASKIFQNRAQNGPKTVPSESQIKLKNPLKVWCFSEGPSLRDPRTR